MMMAVVCNDAQKEALTGRGWNAGTEVVFVNSPKAIPSGANVVMDLLFRNEAERIAALRQWLPRPVIINSVAATLAELGAPFIRINAWHGFLQHELLEIAALPAQQSGLDQIFSRLGWKYRLVPDIAGLISARVIAMIVNEAWFTYGAGISSREEIDIAMKSGTNYPYGPFEWSEKIGVSNICDVLTRMRDSHRRYEIAPGLQAACAASL